MEVPMPNSLDASQLEELGKSAARLSETSGLSLTEAVIRTVGESKLAAEQIRRVVEQCNITAVNNKFASLTGPNRYTHIDGGPADPMVVISAVKAAEAQVRPLEIHALEYSSPPQFEKRASRPVFQATAPSLPALMEKLAAAHEEVSSTLEAVDFQMEEALEALKLAARRSVVEGAGLSELVTAWAATGEPVLAKVAAAQLKDIPWGEVTAGRYVDPSHSVVVQFTKFAALAHRLHDTTKSRLSIEAELAKVGTYMRGAQA